ncbi:camphor resistance protein CrcB [Arthrobacter subterraneus]|uniref:Fluoride-specific ion channel FluC n=1 Tax=Arthrobacter subterraneus TaxID=335973 RepID=A0A1G8KAB5_9MICC|nr:fluoride efflux transporter CrcB [Arthrobacter subterraneus]SDI40317.1 camphor resistance protein CrcB [Arthrobacter subterraneus]
MIILFLSLAGGLGAGTRFIVDGLISARAGNSLPLGTFLINVSGSLLLGLLVGAALSGRISSEWQLITGAGFLGGYTTFSTASVETVRLLQCRRPIWAVLYGAGTAVAAAVAAAVGITCARF